jgi:hypothetical protein
MWNESALMPRDGLAMLRSQGWTDPVARGIR